MWTVQEAEAQLSEVLKRARDGEAQVIGAQDPCVVISMDEYKRLSSKNEEPHLGKWLVENTPHIGDIELPTRAKDRPDPFAGFLEDEEGV
jgi:prevent-host-death family protein